ncbi:MAG TPA: sugar ABC transporter ATP-binding protein [Blastocatellia bacterium]|nr:sugar ABC transporter ATP-binding protein [Blastocatellia bacterium]
MTDTVLLRVTDLFKTFAGVHALRGASFELRSGEVHALIGENGAGKSTLIRTITGAVEADSGHIELDGKPVTHNSPRLAKSRGIAAIYQQPSLFPELSVAENLALGLEQPCLWRPINWSARRNRAADLLAQIGAGIDPDALACDLSMPQQQMLEIARAIRADARVVIMDEPTASLSDEDVQNLFKMIRQLKSGGAGIIYISHRLDELPAIADRVTVLRDGCTIETNPMDRVTRDELIRLMVGRELGAIFPKRAVKIGEPVLELRGFGRSSAGVAEVNLSVCKGEVVGLAGLVGCGRSELARTIFGLTPADQGEMLLRGEPVNITSPADAIRQGIAYLPEDRRRHGVIAELPVSANITLASLGRWTRSQFRLQRIAPETEDGDLCVPRLKLSRWGWMDFRREREIASDYIRRLGIKTPAVFSPVSTLSGGNQQKVALSRWLAVRPSVLILDEPTQGIDVGAKAEIHELMMELAEQGAAILMISSELPEILGMSDRVAVMRGGTICAVLNRGEAAQQRILALALGHEDGDATTLPMRP